LLWVALIANGFLGAVCCFRDFAIAGSPHGAAFGDNHLFALALFAVGMLFYVNFVSLLLAVFDSSHVKIVLPGVRLPSQRTVAVLTNAALVVLAFAPWEVWEPDMPPFRTGSVFASIAVLSLAAVSLWSRTQ
jgi:hypothetical protein